MIYSDLARRFDTTDGEVAESNSVKLDCISHKLPRENTSFGTGVSSTHRLPNYAIVGGSFFKRPLLFIPHFNYISSCQLLACQRTKQMLAATCFLFESRSTGKPRRHLWVLIHRSRQPRVSPTVEVRAFGGSRDVGDPYRVTLRWRRRQLKPPPRASFLRLLLSTKSAAEADQSSTNPSLPPVGHASIQKLPFLTFASIR